MNTEGIRADARDVIERRAKGETRYLIVEPTAILKLLDVVDAAEELERYIWANPGFPEHIPGTVDARRRLEDGARRRQELAQNVSDALAALPESEVST